MSDFKPKLFCATYPCHILIRKIWQFGKLIADVFTRNRNLYVIQDLDKLFAAVNYIFQQCELKIQKE